VTPPHPFVSFLPSQAGRGSPAAGAANGATRIHDPEWNRLIFRAPALPNPQAIFDPMPFRNQQGGKPLGFRPGGR
jgi:hypothetical protein